MDFLHHALALGGVTKRASIPLASAESRWWESGALGGKNGAMVGRREGREDEREGRGAEVQREETKPPRTPALARRRTNGWGRPGVSVLPALNRCTWRRGGGWFMTKTG